VPPFLEAIIAPKTLIGSFLVLFIGGLMFYPLTSGTSWLYYRVLRRKRFFPNDEENLAKEATQRNTEWKWSVYNLLGNAVLTTPFHHLIVTGHSRLYFDNPFASASSTGYLLLTVVVVLVVTEPAVYWAHRILHWRWMYKHIHVHHHQFRVCSPWTSMAFHPVDSFMQALPHHLLTLVLPMHGGVYIFFIMFLQVWSTFIHERVSFARWGFINYSAHHTLHHWANKYNFGQFFTVCDRIWGTYRAPLGIVYDGADPTGAVARTRNIRGPVKPAQELSS